MRDRTGLVAEFARGRDARFAPCGSRPCHDEARACRHRTASWSSCYDALMGRGKLVLWLRRERRQAGVPACLLRRCHPVLPDDGRPRPPAAAPDRAMGTPQVRTNCPSAPHRFESDGRRRRGKVSRIHEKAGPDRPARLLRALPPPERNRTVPPAGPRKSAGRSPRSARPVGLKAPRGLSASSRTLRRNAQPGSGQHRHRGPRTMRRDRGPSGAASPARSKWR